MHNVTAPKNTRVMTISGKAPTVGKGHQPHRGGGGKHGDRRLKRLNTRDSQFREALRG